MSSILLSTHFETYFRVMLAHRPEHIEWAQRIRYDVYCKEFHFELEENCPGGLEKDDYDADTTSLQCIVLHKGSNTPAGCVRLIKIPRRNPSTLLPLERFCGHSLTHPVLHPSRLPRETLCEISRLAVHTTFRRRPGENASPFGSKDFQYNEEERRTFPLISVALIAASTAMMVIAKRPNLFIMVESWLARLLRKLGLDFTSVGSEINYHGPRAAYFITVEQMKTGMKGELRELYGFVESSLHADADASACPGFDFSA